MDDFEVIPQNFKEENEVIKTETTSNETLIQEVKKAFDVQTPGMLDQLRNNNDQHWVVRNIKNIFIGTPIFGRKCTTIITRYGHLVANPTLVIKLNSSDVERYRNTPEKLIYKTTLEIGGVKIDELYGKMLPIYWHIYNLIPRVYGNKFYLPLPFDAMTGTNAVGLPCYHEVKLHVEFSKIIPEDVKQLLNELNVKYTLPSIVKAVVFLDYYTLPKEQYSLFTPFWENSGPSLFDKAGDCSEGSIEQQIVTINISEFSGSDPIHNINQRIKLSFNGGSMGFIIYFDEPMTFKTMKLQLNGCDIMSDTDYGVFRYLNWRRLNIEPPKEGLDYLFIPFCDGSIQEYCNSLLPTGQIDNMTICINGLDYSKTKENKTNINIVSISKFNSHYFSGMFCRDINANYSDFKLKNFVCC